MNLDELIDRAALVLLVVAQGDEDLVHDAIGADYAAHGTVNIPRVTAAIELALRTIH